MAVYECEHSNMCFPVRCPFRSWRLPHNNQSSVWCLDTAVAAGRGWKVYLTYSEAPGQRTGNLDTECCVCVVLAMRTLSQYLSGVSAAWSLRSQQ